MRARSPRLLLPLALAGVVLAGCSSPKSQDAGAQTDVGVSDDTITIGALTDLSSPFKAQGLAATQGTELWADEVNAAGGICGRQVELITKDHGYKPESALALYDEIAGDVVGFVQIFGTPTFAAVKERVISDDVVAMPSSLSSTFLDTPQVVIPGATYDIEMINGLSWMLEQGMIAPGDSIGHIYVDSDYGQNAALGVAAYAEEHELNVQSVAVSATDTDMTATIAAMKANGVTAIVLSTSPPAMGSVATQNVEQALGVPLLGSTPTWDTALVSSLTPEQLSHYYRVTSQAPFGYTGSDAAVELASAYQQKYTETPLDAVNFGYAGALAFGAILQQACDDDNLTRSGIVEAAAKVQVDTKGITAPLDFSVPGAPAARSVYVEQADASAAGGLTVVSDGLVEAPEAADYQGPHQK
ncbi:ABC transporter substrate-binding protein [Epidermidibacterium keratini]|uniref:ABC transporter substrate-binding protein n=1 Tax=Epidermidibacterium keratini TaxID=1891644 RepID=A0A7L4YQE0_9ACTN|nr:ABC transporter substrate-binding protein [Epidermidibacterium keratini]QHC01114.1 ABC transporter substrate-binding protein [Epidermidibacterium keratini]